MISVVKLLLLVLSAVPLWASAFTCKILSTGQMVQTGSANLYVNLTPQIGVGQNLIVDLTQEIKCKNDSAPPDIDVDHLKLLSGSAYQGALEHFSGAVYWVGKYYPIPLTANTPFYSISNTSYAPLPLKLYLTPLGAAGGKLIRSGELIAVLSVYKIATFDGGYPTTFTWNIYANNDVVLPTGGCDVSSRDVTVTLPDYPASIKVPVNIHCAQSQRLGYSLSGATADAAHTIFSNTASASPASGVGVQMLRAGLAVPANQQVSLGTVGTVPVDLGLTAAYARTGGQVTAGNVQSIVGVTFVYQ